MTASVQTYSRRIRATYPMSVIAEIGSNHNRELATAIDLIARQRSTS